MPALAMQLASLVSPSGQGYGAAFYPVPPWQPRQGFRIDPALLYALARHESRFDPEAVSVRGARGLMQIMPATAEGMEGRGAAASRPAARGRLFDPAYNLELGQKYVRHLAERPQIGDNLMLLLAAYNGGPGNVAKWKRAGGARDPLLFMETIPVRETRNYIARVLPHYWAYRLRLGAPPASLRQMAEGQWPRFVLPDDGALRQAGASATAGSIKMASSLPAR
jgi:soluble lytic murein transglycosylase-like protein